MRAVILDRDDTLVIDRGYLADPAGLEFLPRAAEGLRRLRALGLELIVISNQSGVGRGLFDAAALEAMNARLFEMTREAGAALRAIYCCPHAPEARCDCRKPGQALLQQAAADLGFDPAESFVIGDKASDVEFGRRAGATTLLVGGQQPAGTPEPSATAADYYVRDLVEAADRIASLL